MADLKQYIACWDALVQAERSSKGDVRVVHQVMANHLDSLNEGLTPVMEYISIHFWQFPLGSRRDNREQAIKAYKHQNWATWGSGLHYA